MATPSRSKPLVCTAAALLLTTGIVLVGCTRGVYRRMADRDAYGLTGERAKRLNAKADTKKWEIVPKEDSRLFDGTNPDDPPMPVDDPISAELNFAHKEKTSGAPESQAWRSYLPPSVDGKVVLDSRSAVLVAARNSREFQRAREELFLSALDVTEDRHRFSPTFAAGTNGTSTAAGTFRARTADGQPAYAGSVVSSLTFSQFTAFGGELLANFANTLLWDFGQPGIQTAGSLLNFSVVQPLLRYAGRARNLEALTDSERHLLANVRRMEQYQQSFFLGIVAGRDSTNGPTRSDAGIGSAPASLAGSPSGRTGTPRADGLLGLVEEQQRIRNLESNVARLRSSLEQLEAAFDAGRASSRLQAFQARQALHNAQSSLLTSRASYQSRLDSFKTDLGLPPNLELALRDEFLERFAIVDPASTALQNDVNDIAARLRDRDALQEMAALKKELQSLRGIEKRMSVHFVATRKDVKVFRDSLPRRAAELESFRGRPEIVALNVDASRFNQKALTDKVDQIEEQVGAIEQGVKTTFDSLTDLETELPTLPVEDARARASEISATLSGQVLELSLNQASSRLESLALPEVNLNEEFAVEVARRSRLDWMNARAELVDSWRKIDYAANPLMSGLDLVLDGDMGTTQNNAGRFDGRTGQLRAGLRVDTPLDRLTERNDYREAQIAYQRARRDYMLFEDRVRQSLRNTLRISELSRMNFELRRAALQVALAQVDLARLRLEEPPRPGQAAQIGATTARDLVSALSDLLDAENEFLGLWVGHHVLRMVLDYELGTMALDNDGTWVEPGPFTVTALQRRVGAPLANLSTQNSAGQVAATGSSSRKSVQ